MLKMKYSVDWKVCVEKCFDVGFGCGIVSGMMKVAKWLIFIWIFDGQTEGRFALLINHGTASIEEDIVKFPSFRGDAYKVRFLENYG